jgi:hypothetical protein
LLYPAVKSRKPRGNAAMPPKCSPAAQGEGYEQRAVAEFFTGKTCGHHASFDIPRAALGTCHFPSVKQERRLRDRMQLFGSHHRIGEIHNSVSFKAKKGRKAGRPSPLPFHLTRTCQAPDTPRILPEESRIIACPCAECDEE